jgi:hypothetical protein
MTSFEQTREYKQSKSMNPHCDEIYYKVFNATRVKRTKDTPLDMEFAIDVIVSLPNGSILTGQEKALSYSNIKYGTLTMEFYQNRNTKERGEFFKIASQFYFSGYTNSSLNGFASWKIINIPNLVLWINSVYNLEQLEAKSIPSSGLASFIAIPYGDIPEYCYIAKSQDYE